VEKTKNMGLETGKQLLYIYIYIYVISLPLF